MSLPNRIVVIGPESAGKSTLSADLARILATVWVPEYAREYLENLSRPYEENDLLAIGIGQIDSEDQQLQHAAAHLICDTDLYVVKVWSEAKYGRCPRVILEAIARRRYDLYLLCYPDFPWTPDAQREHPEEKDRAYFYHQYLDIVQQSGIPWAIVRGTESERLALALQAIAALTS